MIRDQSTPINSPQHHCLHVKGCVWAFGRVPMIAIGTLPVFFALRHLLLTRRRPYN